MGKHIYSVFGDKKIWRKKEFRCKWLENYFNENIQNFSVACEILCSYFIRIRDQYRSGPDPNGDVLSVTDGDIEPGCPFAVVIWEKFNEPIIKQLSESDEKTYTRSDRLSYSTPYLWNQWSIPVSELRERGKRTRKKIQTRKNPAGRTSQISLARLLTIFYDFVDFEKSCRAQMLPRVVSFPSAEGSGRFEGTART